MTRPPGDRSEWVQPVPLPPFTFQPYPDMPYPEQLPPRPIDPAQLYPPLGRASPVPFPWRTALLIALPMGGVGAILMVLTGFLLLFTLPLVVIMITVSSWVCLHRGRRSAQADAIGFALALAPLLSVAPFIVLSKFSDLYASIQ